MRRFAAMIIAVAGLAITGSVRAADNYVFSSPPRGTQAAEAHAYDPVAAYLSEVTGKHIVYQYPGNWLSYQQNMRTGKYDLVFDGPHFASWRMAHLGDVPLAQLPGTLSFVVIVKQDNDRIKTINDLAGYPVCGMAPPNLATLTLYAQFPNPARQPLVLAVGSFGQAYHDVLKGRCTAAVLRDAAYAKLAQHRGQTRVVFHSKPIANQVFTAGPRFSAQDQEKMAAALVAPEATQAMAAFLARYTKGKPLVPASVAEYQHLDGLLKGVWGFDGQ